MNTTSRNQLGGAGPPIADLVVTGDLLFPRPRDGWVPYLQQAGRHPREGYGSEEKAWRNIQGRIAAGEGKIPDEARQQIKSMSYDEFRARYGGPANPRLFGLHFYTGHVAIFDSGDVIEALWGDIGRVIRRSYSDWAAEHQDDLVWQSRLTGINENELRELCDEANRQVGAPYDFFDFELMDASGFYCSKLVWFVTRSVLGIAMDDDPNPQRYFWYSPKQLLHSPHLTAIQSPSPY
jgi:cell wall-associated NlpC family hydrolase